VMACMVAVLREFRTAPPLEALRALPVLDEQAPFGVGMEEWPQALATLVERRVERFGAILRRHIDQFDEKYSRVLQSLQRMSPMKTGLIHGDLIPANVLVDDELCPVSVLDFGFLSMYGDPAFDAAVTSSIFEMYGASRTRVEKDLTATFESALGYPSDRLNTYRAAYALITANAYDPQGEDGHFAWCAAMLQREDILASLWMS
jgi:aminoglycoside phosphotransferase (APT) family kinase protein